MARANKDGRFTVAIRDYNESLRGLQQDSASAGTGRHRTLTVLISFCDCSPGGQTDFDSRLDRCGTSPDNFAHELDLQKVIRPEFVLAMMRKIRWAHLHALGWASRHEFVCDAMASFLARQRCRWICFGLRFPNPIGLAPAWINLGKRSPRYARAGFGFTELGGVTGTANPAIPRRAFSGRSPKKPS